jgi:hypothetical protein
LPAASAIWYDFAVFGYFAPFISTQFFPTDDPVAAPINTFGVFAAGYLVRPIGGRALRTDRRSSGAGTRVAFVDLRHGRAHYPYCFSPHSRPGRIPRPGSPCRPAARVIRASHSGICSCPIESCACRLRSAGASRNDLRLRDIANRRADSPWRKPGSRCRPAR